MTKKDVNRYYKVLEKHLSDDDIERLHPILLGGILMCFEEIEKKAMKRARRMEREEILFKT